MATHSSILVCAILWREEPGRLQSVRSQCQIQLSMYRCSTVYQYFCFYSYFSHFKIYNLVLSGLYILKDILEFPLLFIHLVPVISFHFQFLYPMYLIEDFSFVRTDNIYTVFLYLQPRPLVFILKLNTILTIYFFAKTCAVI